MEAAMNVIETERLALRRFTQDDAAFVLEMLNDEAWKRNISDRGIRTVEGVRGYVDDVLLASYQKHGFGLYRLALKADDTPIGMCGLIKRDSLPNVDIGYALLPAFYGKGYAEEAARAVLEHGRSDFGLKRILGTTSLDNEPSVRVLEKIGLTFQEVIQQAGFDKPSKLFAIDF